MMVQEFLHGCRFLILAGLLAASAMGAEAPDAPKPPAETPAASQDHINSLIEQLGDKDYFVRQRAQEELMRLGFEAFDAISEATTNDDLEIASRAKYLLRLMRVQWTIESDPPEVKKTLQDYEFDASQAKQAKMRALAALPNHQGIAALCRLVRFEKSPLLSRTAAVALLNEQSDAAPPDDATVATVRKTLDDSARPGARWLLGWTRLREESDAVMEEWSKHVDEEQKSLTTSPNETSPEIVAGLIRFQIARLKKLGKTEAAMAATRRLLDLQHGNLESLAELLDWLVGQKSWKAVEELAKRFSPQINAEPGLLYLVAEAYAGQNMQEKADKAASRALKLNPGKQQQSLVRHLMAAQHLRSRGLFAWSRKEYEHVIEQADAAENDEIRAMAQSYLAEMLHDQMQDREAAAVLEKLVADIDAGKIIEQELNGQRPSGVRSRMHYFTAMDWESQGDDAKKREALDLALKADPLDIDVLIACYRLPDQTAEFHENILDLIHKAATDAQDQIAEDPEDPSLYNQFAWLIANTEGDLDEALRYSQKSLDLLKQMPELKSNEGGFHDTLGHVYFARGDYEDAVKTQTKAAELDPHSTLIRRQLEVFRKKLEEKKP